ncbi:MULTISPECIES: hypothetical protein [Bacteroides]|jgi:hypothetical protein|uniref:hypothetical protein n=1 Tax=Bacteroides TaxID=816 RepID=UPI001314A3EE|nr:MULTISPECIES: hypothetical protein [Bacteroides]DAW02005.1 MAG TPA: hypothetical protein [Caudoviricetes sp.]
MKHIIRKIEYITGDNRRCEKVIIETNDIETERKQLYAEYPYDVIYFTYETKST